MDFNLETFVTDYTAALRDNNAEEMVKLIASLSNDDQRAEALAGVIAAIESDADLAELASDTLKVLKSAEQVNEAVATESNASAEVAVTAPAIKQEDPVEA